MNKQLRTGTTSRSGCRLFFCDLRDMATLEARDGEFVFAGQARAVALGDCRGAIRTAAADFVHGHLPRLCIRYADNDHALVQQRGMTTEQRRFLAAMLGGGAGEYAADLADQRTFHP